MKKCTKCLKKKNLKEFYINKKSKSGLSYHCRDCNKTYCKLWASKNPSYHMRRLKKYISNLDNYKKHLARNTLHYHVRVGHITKLTCFKCKTTKTEAHHPDHSKPLDVIWTCKTHHLILHLV